MSLQTPGLFFCLFYLVHHLSLHEQLVISCVKTSWGSCTISMHIIVLGMSPSLLTPYELQDHRHSTSRSPRLWPARLLKWPNTWHTSLVFIDTLRGAYMKNLTLHRLSVAPAAPTVLPPLPRPLVNYTLQVLKSQWRTEPAPTVSFSFSFFF